ncbi:hypothetical protein [Pseudoxanthomonas sp.]|uniref:hypothetical protein n=1 Tax=Pseudoxanthomonas sp. TaxID=1871049 RepID=UPI0028C4950F|nr:hypothetical protein [Pseudoxanthomonas sp.]
MKDEKQEFSKRLAEAMRGCGHEPRPVELMRLFNSRYQGTSVTEMSTSRWLNGGAIPNQDKLQVLADLFGVEPHVLRYGRAEKSRVAESLVTWPSLGTRDRQTIDAFLVLTPRHRGLVGDLVEALAAVKPAKS